MVKRPFQLVAEIQDKDTEIARLKARVFQLEAIIEFGSVRTLEQYESLLCRAADALTREHWCDWTKKDVQCNECNLIAELRKAAQ